MLARDIDINEIIRAGRERDAARHHGLRARREAFATGVHCARCRWCRHSSTPRTCRRTCGAPDPMLCPAVTGR